MPLFKPNITALKEKRDLAGLVQALKTTDARTRGDVVRALGDLGDKRAIPTIVQVLQTDEKQLGEKVQAAEVLGKIGDESAIPALFQASETSKQREQETIEAILSSADRRYHANFYVNRISADELELRAMIAQSIARIGGASAIEPLFAMLATEKGAMEASVKNKVREAITALVQKQGAEAVPALCAQVESASIDARQWAVHCLGEFEDAQGISTLVRIASNEDENFDVRLAALSSLGKAGDKNALPHVEELINAPNRVIARDARQCSTAIRMRLGLPRLPGF